MSLNLKEFRPYLILLISVLLVYWPLASMQHVMKWDAVDQYYPWRFFVGECLQNGILPLWNPYQQLGYPIFGDPQSGAWYPIVWVLGYLFGYDIYIFQAEFILHVFLASAGTYKLCRCLGISSNISVICGLAYSVCGLFVGNAQHLTWVIGATWLPFVLYSFLLLLRNYSIRHALLFAVFTYLLISGGYPAFAIILTYLLVLFLGIRIVELIRKKSSGELIPLIRSLATAGIATILLCAVNVISILSVTDYISRGQGVDVQAALFGAFTPQCLVSLITPFATSSYADISLFETDLSMANGYFGIVLLPFFLLAFFRKKSRTEWTFLVAGLFFLLASMGGYLPVREFLYDYFPFMDLFRFPSVFRAFFIICAIVIAGYSIQSSEKKISLLTGITSVLIICLIAGIIYVKTGTDYESLRSLLLNYSETIGSSGLEEHFMLQGLIQILLLCGLLAIVHCKNKKLKLRLIYVWLVFDLGIATALSGPVTVYNTNIFAGRVKEATRELPDGFPVPEVKVSEASDISITRPLWKNTNIFLKRVSDDGFNPFVLASFNHFYNSSLRKGTIDNLPLFFADSIVTLDHMEPEMFTDTTGNTLYTSEKIKQSLKSISTTDTVITETFEPGNIVVRTHTSQTRPLLVLQNYFPGWKVFIDGHESTLIPANFTLISVLVPPGEHLVEFRYKNPKVVAGALISFISFMVALLIIIKKTCGNKIFR